jgi:O-methyltransferase domain/Dimerisation domain
MRESVKTSPDLPPAVAVRRLIFGHRVAQVLATAAQLGLADHLSETPKTAAQLAPLVQANARSLHRFLRALASIGIVTEGEDGSFALAPLGACLRADTPSNMRSWALFECAEHFQRSWSDLLYSVQTGEPASTHVLGMDVFTYMKQHPEVERSFSKAMGASATLAAEAIVNAYDFSQANQIVDVGGGHGILLVAILLRHSAVRGVLFDVSAVVDRARQGLRAAGFATRAEVIGGDFFEGVPSGGDVYILSRVLMGYEDDGCVRILRNCNKVMAESGRVLIIQQVMPPQGSTASRDLLFEGTMSDLNMLVMTGGYERTEAQYRDLLEAAGLKLTRVVPTRSLMSVLEGTRA